ncbi:MAG TPA: DNRLRE domain-containing protein [Prolixibacteraceae bacterium]|jgi:hypothetical protein
MKYKFSLLSVAGILFCTLSMRAQTTIILNAVKDNTLYQDEVGSKSNGSGEHFFVGKNNLNSIRRGLIKFDIASNVPAGVTILEATLTLSMDQTTSAASNIELHPLTSDWGEGASVTPINGGSGVQAQTNDATWLHTFYNSSLWNTPGGDFSASASATTSVNGVGTYSWTSAQLVADVQKWVDAPTSNFGWCLTGNEVYPQTTKRFASREIATVASRPFLTTVYLIPVGVRETNTGSRCSIYPNPSQGKMKLTVGKVINPAVKIYNILGIVVYSKAMVDNQLSIDLSKEPGGIYFYEVLSNDRMVEMGKIIIRNPSSR